ncbi:hypothetical protein LX97_00190 [Nonlabens dokdonensis]|uniref:DUF4190 domain-containing protein n=2 Tax=Nonlabens dokdonensis TaxID=328515 RepID=L7W5W3_NONDD|nr:CCC motif membrane protein [Nonlabens dokdonensis]AGC75494.1 hypothetical protein DDD_0367 [Nonlabens dokdonensis DSW-6]PZX43190.1 hypothetical protein LX97_00190 [Nonlabens dokdonensis]
MQKLNTTLVYILSVVGFLCCCAYGIGTVAAIIAIVVASKELKKYEANPDQFVNGKAMKTAKTVAIVSLVISLIGLAIFIASALNECAFNEWIYNWSLDNGASEEQLAPMLEEMEKAGCV